MSTLNTPQDPRLSVPNPLESNGWLRNSAWALVGGSFLLVISYWSKLPPEVPTHWNGAGEITSYGPRGAVWLLPVINLLLVYGLQFAGRTPLDMFNYPVGITEENAAAQHRIALELLAVVRMICALLLFVVTYFVVATAASGENKFSEPIFWLLMVGLFAAIGYYIWRAFAQE